MQSNFPTRDCFTSIVCVVYDSDIYRISIMNPNCFKESTSNALMICTDLLGCETQLGRVSVAALSVVLSVATRCADPHLHSMHLLLRYLEF